MDALCSMYVSFAFLTYELMDVRLAVLGIVAIAEGDISQSGFRGICLIFFGVVSSCQEEELLEG